MHFLRFAPGLILLGILALSCQSSALHRIDDKALSDLAIDEKAKILLAEGARSQSLEAVHHAEADVDAARRDVSVAEAEIHRMQAEVRKDEAELDYALARHDQQRIATSRLRLDLEREGTRVAQASLSVARERLGFAEHQVEVAQAEHRWNDARYELERARLAAAKGRITLKDRPVRDFEEQEDRTHRDLIDARLGTRRHQDQMDEAARTYQELEKAYKAHQGGEQ